MDTLVTELAVFFSPPRMPFPQIRKSISLVVGESMSFVLLTMSRGRADYMRQEQREHEQE